jgi:hypothetical protein
MICRSESFATSESYPNGMEVVHQASERKGIIVIHETFEPGEIDESGLEWKIRLRI